MEKNKKAIDLLRKSLGEQSKTRKKITLAEMIYNDNYQQEEDSPGYESMPEFDSEEHADFSDERQMGNKPIEKQLPSERTSDPEIMNILSNIRMAVINGLAKLAKKPETVEYDTLKKILQIVDKPIDAVNKEK